MSSNYIIYVSQFNHGSTQKQKQQYGQLGISLKRGLENAGAGS
uniref:Uncharacterized protein n=1 Tax=Arundo donax TaxID=35708 RepID=A0A0A9AWY3_ARUDO